MIGEADDPFFLQDFRHGIGDDLARHFVDDVEHGGERLVQRFAIGPAGQPFRLVVHQDDAPFRIRDNDAVADGGERHAQPFLLLLEIGFRTTEGGMAQLDGVEGLAIGPGQDDHLLSDDIGDGKRQQDHERASGVGQHHFHPANLVETLVAQGDLGSGEHIEFSLDIIHDPFAHPDPIGIRGILRRTLGNHGLGVVAPDEAGLDEIVRVDALLGTVAHEPFQVRQLLFGRIVPGLVGFYEIGVAGQKISPDVILRGEKDILAFPRLREDLVGMVRPTDHFKQHERIDEQKKRRDQNNANRPQDRCVKRPGEFRGIGIDGHGSTIVQALFRAKSLFAGGRP